MSTPNLNDKLIISQNDKDILDILNQNRNHLEDGLVWEAWVVSLKIWLPNDDIEGVIDISFPVGEDSSFGFSDVLEANVKKDSIGIYRLYSRERGSDIPKHFISIIEQNLLIPVSMGAVIPYHGHVFGKGLVCKVADLKAKQFRSVLEKVEIISPYENEILIGLKENGALPKNYKRKAKKETIDYKEMIRDGENEKIEFKASARWDYRKSWLYPNLSNELVSKITTFIRKLLVSPSVEWKIKIDRIAF